MTGPEIPKDFPAKYTKDLKRVGLFNASMSWDIQQLVRWEERHGIQMEKEPSAIFEDYLRTNHVIFSTLVEHPKVNDAARYTACSVVLQRGVIVYGSPRERLFLRSYFHSAKDSENFANFVPRGGIEISFASDTIWFPLELTRVIQEPASYVVLDILTPKPFRTKELREPFRVGKGGEISYEGRKYYVSRVTAKLAAKQKWPDLRLQP